MQCTLKLHVTLSVNIAIYELNGNTLSKHQNVFKLSLALEAIQLHLNFFNEQYFDFYKLDTQELNSISHILSRPYIYIA